MGQGTPLPLPRFFEYLNQQLLTFSSSELSSKIHRQFRAAHEGHRPHAGLDPSRASTGVVWTTERAYVSVVIVELRIYYKSMNIEGTIPTNDPLGYSKDLKRQLCIIS